MITVVTHRAYSAAAILLSRGDYSVALEHADILFHDVRYGGMEDVTPQRALDAAKKLSATNESTSLSLADQMFKRWMWNYLDLNGKFEVDRKRFPEAAKRYLDNLSTCSLAAAPSVRFDIDGFATSIFARLSRENEALLDKAMTHLQRWGASRALATAVLKYSTEDASPGLLDGALELFNLMSKAASTIPFGGAESEGDLSLFLTLILSRLNISKGTSSATNFERALSDFQLVKSIDNPRHVQTATRMILRHRFTFLDIDTANQWDDMSTEQRKKVMEEATPIVKVAWLFCILVARELFKGDHQLSPKEAMALGLVDEAPGSSDLGSRRQFLLDSARAAPKKPPENMPRRTLIKRRINRR
jgi:ATP-dependent protease ClpP protease subunit